MKLKEFHYLDRQLWWCLVLVSRGGGSFYSWLLPSSLLIIKPGSSWEHYWFHSKHNKWWHECSIICWLHGLGCKAAIKQMAPLKALGLNGMPSIVYQNYWQLVGNDVTQSILNFLNTTTLPSHLNYTYVTLIPKVKNLTTLGITVTLKLIFDVLRVPQIEKLDYPGSPVLSSFSRDALASHLCECPSITPSSKLVLDFFIHY